MGFQRAQRQKVFVKLAITGPSGSGKTYSALKLAFGMGKKVAMIDTENGSGSLYAHLGEYDVCPVGAPYQCKKYVDGIKEAVAGGYEVLIIDSLSHAWAGEGGLLQKKEALDVHGGNQFTNWAQITKEHEWLKTAILHAPIHIIVTMRSKQEYALQEDGKGRTKPVKVGMAPIQRNDVEYEFTTVFDLGMDHSALTSKDRTGLFDGNSEALSEKHGAAILEWLAGGVDAPPVSAPPARPVPDPAPVSNGSPSPTLEGEIQRRREEAATPAAPMPAPVDPEYQQLRTEFIGMARMAGLDATEAERLFAEHAEGDTDAAQRLVDAVVADDFDIKREWEMLLETERELAAQGSDAPLPEPPPEPEPVPTPAPTRPTPTQAAPQNRQAPRANGNPAQSGDLATAAQRRMVEALLAQAKEKRDLTGLTRGQAEKMITELKDRLSPARAG